MESTVGSAGGTVTPDNGDFALLIPQGAFSEETTIMVGSLPVEDHPLLDSRLTGTGKIYRFSGLTEFSEPLVIEMAIPASRKSGEDSLIVYLEEQVFLDDPTELGYAGRPLLDTVVDREAGVIRATIPPHIYEDHPEEGLAKSSNFLDFILGRAEHHLLTYSTDQFQITWEQGEVDQDWIEDLHQDLVTAKTKLIDMGYEYCVTGPVDIQIEPIPDADGMFNQSGFGTTWSYITLAPSLEDNEKLASAGHELFHLVQTCYGNGGHIWGYCHKWCPEACSIWFEPILLDDPTYVAEIQNTNRNFLRDGLEKNDDKTGYGAAAFFTWLTDRYSRNLVLEINRKIAEDPRAAGGGVKAMSAAFASHNLILRNEFTLFVKDFTTGTTGHSGWSMPDHAEQVILSQGRRSHLFAPKMMDYSAMPYLIANGWTDEMAPALSLVVESTSQENVTAYVYKGATPTGPWSQAGAVFPSHPVTVGSFGQLDNTKKVKVVLVNVQDEEPYTGKTQAGIKVRYATCPETEVDSFDGYIRAIVHVSVGGAPVNEANISYRYRKIHCDGHLGGTSTYTGKTGQNGIYYAEMLGVFTASNTQERFVVEATYNGVTKKSFLPMASLIGSNLFWPVEANVRFEF